ncbi:MAG: AIPR family protein, partial [Marinobacter sp.]|nr:AIPR family protein [Marinobacter sp.]MDX5473758.1 AIPR family protein [Marinobacter sp.]
LYELAEDDKEFVQDITYATNSQNPVDLRDLRANDERQHQLELGMRDLGFNYRRKRDDTSVKNDELTSSVVAEAVLAVWRRKPFQAKFRRKELFGKLYEEVFCNLNSTQAILAALIFRMVENERKRPEQANPPIFLPYASHYKAMLVGDYLLETEGVALAEVNHRNYPVLLDRLNRQFDEFQHRAQDQISEALTALYGQREISLQQLSATFRRGDLMQYLNPAEEAGAAH